MPCSGRSTTYGLRPSAESEATVAGIEETIDDARSRGQRKHLRKQRTQALVNQQVDLARHPTIGWADKPEVPNGNLKKVGVIGLLVGALLGAGLAFARASRRTCFDDR